ncbi:unnamed protein product, partial [Ectocarpus sp. 12 AP-2014]
NDRICYLRVAARPCDLFIINVYAPTEDNDDDIKDVFYEKLEKVYDDLPNNSIKIILGDLNAQVGKEAMYRPTIGPNSLHDICNDNGTRLVNFAISKNISISSTYFPHKNIHKQTWKSPDGVTLNQIDHVLINSRFKSSIFDVRSYRGADANSDHFLVMAKFANRISTKWNPQDPAKKITSRYN